jgi:3-methyladenine DNA glycosylase Mpg
VRFALNHAGKEEGSVTSRSMVSTMSQANEKAGPLEKLLLALSLQNTYGDRPLCEREELFETRKHLQSKLTKVNWPGVDNLTDYSWRDDEGNIYLQSIDDDLC